MVYSFPLVRLNYKLLLWSDVSERIYLIFTIKKNQQSNYIMLFFITHDIFKK